MRRFIILKLFFTLVNAGCRDSTFGQCLIDEQPFESAKGSDMTTCQLFCNVIYADRCKFFEYDRRQKVCQMFDSDYPEDFASNCQIIGGSPNPDLSNCHLDLDECLRFKEGYCLFYGDLLENFEGIDDVDKCQIACRLREKCRYFVYNNPASNCQLLTSSMRKCDVVLGPSAPPYDSVCGDSTSTTLQPTTSESTLLTTSTELLTTTQITVETTTQTTTTQETTTFPHPTDFVTMIATGLGEFGGVEETEVIDLKNGSICSQLGAFPSNKTVRRSFGGLLWNKYPLVCGGKYVTNFQLSDRCYVIGSNEIREVAIMSRERQQAASIVVDDGKKLWIIGGSNDRDWNLGTEYIELDVSGTSGKSIQGPEPPCQAGNPNGPCDYKSRVVSEATIERLNDHELILIGGFGFRLFLLDLTFIFDSKTEVWTKGPPLLEARCMHASGVIIDAITEEKYIVVSGGASHSQALLNSVELLSVSNPTSWIKGPSLPRGLCDHQMVSHGNRLFAMGGSISSSISIPQKDIYELTCSNLTCIWTKQEQSLKQARNSFITLPIPRDLTNC